MQTRLFTYQLSREQFEKYRDPDNSYKRQGEYFSDVTDPGEKVPAKGVALIHAHEDGGDFIYALAAFTRTGRVATERSRFRIWEIHEIYPIPVRRVVDRLEARVKPYAITAFQSNREIPPATSRDFLSALMRLSGDTVNAYRRISRLVGHHISIDRPNLSIKAQEKDAVSLSLDIFGMERAILMPADQAVDTTAPFLAGVDGYRANEDAMIGHDIRFFEGVQSVPGAVLGSAVFELEGRKLTVFNANRGPIEATLGVDLVYYNHERQSFVMLQYKRMLREGGRWRYRGDVQFRKEVRRMQKYNVDSAVRSDGDYRLNPLPFYFKFIRTCDYNPGSLNLLAGLYVPLEHLTDMMSSDQFTTTAGNLALDHDETPHLKSALFTGLTRDGLIGSRGTTTDTINQLCTSSLNRGRAVVLSVEESTI
ncbi:hypothetical protein [Streptomyces rochei]|uniref:hypothetical protein n=1 Tax=Streptomyces rochei TaxID=1928 RepID=UPI0034276353